MGLSDVAISASRREGLPVNVMEAMATGLALVVSDCRGNVDLITNNETGYIVEKNNVEAYTKAIYNLYSNENLRKEFGDKALASVQKYSTDNVMSDMLKIYKRFFDK